jgi:FkbM family methyltransferase
MGIWAAFQADLISLPWALPCLCFSRMHPPSASEHRRFWERANDLNARDWPSKLNRFLRAQWRSWCMAGAQLADDPRVVRAWRRHWDGAHCIQLLRWRDGGFRPRVVYDIGAHEGLWSEMCQDLLGPAECVLFEPQQEFRAKAQLRAPKSGGHWNVLPFALGDREETHALHLTKNLAASSLLAPLSQEAANIQSIETVGEEKVQVVCLDTLAAGKGLPLPDLVKIDVQGFEARVLAGGQKTLSQSQRMVVEVSLHPLYAGQSLMPEVLTQLSSWGFALEDIHETYRQWPGRLWQVDLWLRRPNA